MRGGFAGIMGFLLTLVIGACAILAIIGMAHEELTYVGIFGMGVSAFVHMTWVSRKNRGLEVTAIKWGLIGFMLSAALALGCFIAKMVAHEL